MRSHLLRGKVVHRRTRPAKYALEHDVWYMALDLDELDVLGRWSRLIGHNSRGIVSFHDHDYLPAPADNLALDLRAHLDASDIDVSGGRILLVTTPRVLGYEFNPASFYLCRGASGTLECVVIEVHNTYRERHLYTLRPERLESPVFTARMDKQFFVSPFIGPHGAYRVSVRDIGDGLLAIGINESDEGETLLATSLVLRRMPLTRRNLIALLVRHPLVSHKTSLLIHWHAMRLWLKGVPFNHHVPGMRRLAADRRPR